MKIMAYAPRFFQKVSDTVSPASARVGPGIPVLLILALALPSPPAFALRPALNKSGLEETLHPRAKMEEVAPLTPSAAGDVLSHFRLVLPVTTGGVGDVSQLLTLGRILRKAFPQADVEIQLGRKNREKADMLLGGTPDDSLFRIVDLEDVKKQQDASSDFASITYLPKGRRERFERHISSAKINLYIFEPDAEVEYLYALPQGWRFNEVAQDEAGRLHLPVKTGFDPTSFGMLFDPETLETHPGLPEKERLWEILISGKEVPDHLTLEVVQSDWAIAHYFYGINLFRYLGLIEEMLSEGSLPARDLTIFDMTEFSLPEVSESHVNSFESARGQNRTIFTHIYWDAEGHHREVLGIQYPEVRVIHLGPRPHPLFTGVLAATTFPVFVTGSAILAEAIQLKKRWIYEAPHWKKRALLNWAKAAIHFLTREEAELLISISGFSQEEVEEQNPMAEVDRLFQVREKTVEYPKEVFVNAKTQAAMDRLNDALVARHSLGDRLIVELKKLSQILSSRESQAPAGGLEEGVVNWLSAEDLISGMEKTFGQVVEELFQYEQKHPDHNSPDAASGYHIVLGALKQFTNPPEWTFLR